MIVIIILLVFLLIVLLRVASVEKFMTFTEMLSSLPATKKQIIDASQGSLESNTEDVINKTIKENILKKVVGHQINDKNSIINKEAENLENIEVNDFISKIFKLDNQIFTDSINHELLCNNLKYELIKLIEADKSVDMIARDYQISNKNVN